jgi:hypothetical protein
VEFRHGARIRPRPGQVVGILAIAQESLIAPGR